MSSTVYAIGDIQGCYKEFKALLKKIDFAPDTQQLWIAGDLVNRGPDSLQVLRYIKALHDEGAAKVVLGNHDLHLLAAAAGLREQHASDTLKPILKAKDSDQLCEWLSQQPLMHYSKKHRFAMTHAGISPQWSIKEALSYAQEVESILRSDKRSSLLAAMYGNEPNLWDTKLTGMNRYRFIINAFTRMRFCDENTGALNFDDKSKPGMQAPHLSPWFACKSRQHNTRIVFGHWAALELSHEECLKHGVFHIDTGCVWGRQLTALNLSSLQRVQVNSELAA